MRTVIIIHGSYGSPSENWFPWLQAKIQSSGHHAIVPTFPTPEGQSLITWQRALEEQAGSITSDHILVGHSLGVGFIFNILECSANPVRGSFLASGFIGELGNPEFDNVNRTFVCRKFDWRKIRSNMGKAFLYHGDNDPYVPTSKCTELADKLNLKPNFIKNGGHLNASAGFRKFELLWSDLSQLL